MDSEWDALVAMNSHSHRLLGMSLAGVAVPPLPIMPQSLTGSAPILAVRAGRRAIADNPMHAESYYRLFKAYEALRDEEAFVAQVPNATRDAQMVYALRQAVLLDPDIPEWHIELAMWYFQRNVPDLGIAHYQAALRSLRLVPLPVLRNLLALRRIDAGDTAEDHEKARLLYLDVSFNLRMDQVEERFRKLRADYNSRATLMRDPQESAQHARGLNLLDQARLDLERAVQRMPAEPPFQPRDNEAFRQLLQLYLQLGQLPEATMLLSRRDAGLRLQPVLYDHMAAQVYAADGNYEYALGHRQTVDEILQALSVDQALSALTTQFLGVESATPGSNLRAFLGVRESVDLQRQRADLLVESGLLLLEAGRAVPAAEYFRRAVEDVHNQSSYSPLAGRYYHLITRKSLGDGPAVAKAPAAPDADKPTDAKAALQK